MVAISRHPANYAVVVALLEAGATATKNNDVGDSALRCACNYGHKEIARLLIRHGAQATDEIKTWLFDRIEDGLE
jgi:ankyrin repeat protein